MNMAFVSRVVLAILAAALAVASPWSARAAGTVLVQQRDGSIKTYNNVRITVGNAQMEITSADGQGTLVLGKAACTKVGDLVRCIPYDATLFQNGLKMHIFVQSGTVWLNPTTSNQPLALSSAQLPPHGVLLSLHTRAGTYVSLTGTVDGTHQ
jgi:hypothetical protein